MLTHEEERMVKSLRQFSVAPPVVMLATWIAENTRYIVNGIDTAYARKHAAPRLEIQARLMRMYEDGLLDENLKEVEREHQKADAQRDGSETAGAR